MTAQPKREPYTLEIDRGWQIECWRCANEAFSYYQDAPEALAEFLELGWRREADGFQMCPRCMNASQT